MIRFAVPTVLTIIGLNLGAFAAPFVLGSIFERDAAQSSLTTTLFVLRLVADALHVLWSIRLLRSPAVAHPGFGRVVRGLTWAWLVAGTGAGIATIAGSSGGWWITASQGLLPYAIVTTLLLSSSSASSFAARFGVVAAIVAMLTTLIDVSAASLDPELQTLLALPLLALTGIGALSVVCLFAAVVIVARRETAR